MTKNSNIPFFSIAITISCLINFACSPNHKRNRNYLEKTLQKPQTKVATATVNQPITSAHLSTLAINTLDSTERLKAFDLVQKRPDDFTHSGPISREELAAASPKARQIVAVLINRKILFFKENILFDFNSQVVYRGALLDYLHRVSAYLQNGGFRPSPKSGNFSLADAGQQKQNHTMLMSKEELSHAIGVMSAVGTFFWGYREWTSNSQIIEDAKKNYSQKLKSIEKFESLNARITALEKAESINSTTKTKLEIENYRPPNSQLDKVGGRLWDPSQARFGKYIFSPLLLVTSFAILGVTFDDMNSP